MSYVDGFVAAVPSANREAYRDHATREANPMPFDGKRLIFGGFDMIVEQR